MVLADKKSVFTYLNFGHISDRFHQGEDGNFELHLRKLAQRERHESRITYCRCYRTFRSTSKQGLHWMYVSDTPAKVALFMNRHKYSIRFYQQTGRHIRQTQRLPQEMGLNRVSSDLQEKLLLALS